MKVLHISQGKPYEEVELIANRVNRNNSLAVIKKDNSIFYTGGFIVENNPIITNYLDKFADSLHYEAIKDFRTIPFVKDYYEEDDSKTI